MPDSALLAGPNITTMTMSPAAGVTGWVRTAFERALAGEGKISDAVLALPGMSGQTYRRFINNLIEIIPDPRYLEVGVWQGSTFCSAIFSNEVTATAIDNWSQFDGPSDKFLEHLSKFKGKAKVDVLERDFRDVDFRHLGRTFNVYLFDGPHAREDQYDGVTFAKPALDDAFVLIVDDWNWEQVRLGTFDGIRGAGYQVEWSVEIRTSLDNSHGPVRIAEGGIGCISDWHNGYFIAAMRKA
jgi:hypothetical protein